MPVCREDWASAEDSVSHGVRETDLAAVLSYARYTLSNTELATELAPLCEQREVGLINAAAVALGLLIPAGSRIAVPAGEQVRAADVCATGC